MGAQQSISTSVNKVLNESISNTMISNVSNSAQNNAASNSISFDNITAGPGCNLDFSNISQKLIQIPNFSSMSSNSNSQDLQTKFNTALDQKVDSAVSGLAGGVYTASVSKAISDTKNIVKNNTNISNLATCVQDNIAKNTANFAHIVTNCPGYCASTVGCPKDNVCDFSLCTTKFDNITQDLTQKAVASCVSQNTTVSKAMTDLTNTITQATSSKNTGIDPMGSIMTLVIIYCILKFLKSNNIPPFSLIPFI